VKNLKTGESSKVLETNKNSTILQFSGTRIVGLQAVSSIKSIIYEKNFATGSYSKVITTTNYLESPAISGTRVVWAQYDPLMSHVAI